MSLLWCFLPALILIAHGLQQALQALLRQMWRESCQRQQWLLIHFMYNRVVRTKGNFWSNSSAVKEVNSFLLEGAKRSSASRGLVAACVLERLTWPKFNLVCFHHNTAAFSSSD
jgi:hypothetical protein